MDKSLYSSSWYRVSAVKPRLRSHAHIHRQIFRGQLWYVSQDRTSGRFMRFTPAAYFVISLMDGVRSVQEIWDLACGRLGDDVLTQDEMIRVLSQLHRSDVLRADSMPDVSEVSERGAKEKRKKLLMSMMNPLALRIPLWDPDVFLTRTFRFIRPIFSVYGVAAMILLMTYALIQAGLHWDELTMNLSDRVLAAESLLSLFVTYPLVKGLHELGHGYAIKRWHGEAHEMGLMFLVFMPVPYVDASEASGFQNKWHRAIVGMAGIIVELILASLALIVWLNAEEGLVRALAFNVMLIGGVSTLLFNGNPLLRFDGYYTFCDLIEIPNLGSRSNRYIGYLIQRYLFGVKDIKSPAHSPGEARWMGFYSISAFIYRLFIMTVIVSFVASRFFVVGVIMAIWSVILMLGLPLYKQIKFLLTNPILRRVRRKAFGVTAGVIAGLFAFLMLVPLPYAQVSEGVVWSPDGAAVHAGSEGLVTQVLAMPNAQVKAGDPLVQMADPLLAAKVKVLEAQVKELRLRYEARDFVDPLEAKIISERLAHTLADLELERKHQDDLLVRSNGVGEFVIPDATDLPGQFFRKGQTIGYVHNPENPIIQVIVPEDDADQVRRRIRSVEVRYVNDMARIYTAELGREVPMLTTTMPSRALTSAGGGQVVLDPKDKDGMTALESYLQLEIRPAATPVEVAPLGTRVYVRFDLGYEPLGFRMYRTVRQVFLRRFSV
jgi:putative peptide zinc metalloprotease protein